jgi:hypothetical protein
VPGSNSSRYRRFLDIALTLAIGYLATWRILFSPGVVGLVHDWSVYPFPDQHIALARQMFDGWYSWGLGTPVVYPTEYPLRFLLGVLAAVHVDGAAMSKAFVFASPAAAFFFMVQLLRARGMSTLPSYGGGLLYGCSPVMLNKLVSGQTSYLFSYALMPLFGLAVLRALKVERRRVMAAVAVGAMLAVVSIQLQLGLVALGILFLATLFTASDTRWRLAFFGCVLVTLCLCELSTCIGVATGASTLVSQPLAIESPGWFQIQSVTGWDALRLDGYFAHYDATAVARYAPLWTAAAWVIVSVVLLGFVNVPIALRSASLIGLAVLFPIVMGSYSVFGPFFQKLVLSDPVFDVFRELYHFMAGIAFVYALLFAAGATWLLRRFGFVSYAVAAIALLVFVSPVLTGDAAGLLRTYTYGSYLAPAFARENRGAMRAAWFPMDQPLAYDGSGTGVDPLSVTRRGSLWLYRLSWPLTVVDTYARSGDPRLEALLRRLSVGDAIERPRFRSVLAAFSVDPHAAQSFFDQRLKLDKVLGPGTDLGNGVTDYALNGAQPMLSSAQGLALMPQRVEALLSIQDGWAASPFVVTPPDGIPYIVLRDPGDAPEETLEASRLNVNALASATVDARAGFAPLSLWWWLHPQYADSPGGLLAIGSQKIDTRIRSAGPAIVVLAWICTPYGGHVRINAGAIAENIDTACRTSGWLSRKFVIHGPVDVVVSTIDSRREVALRGLSVVSMKQWGSANLHWSDLLRHAGATVTVESLSNANVKRRLEAAKRASLEKIVVYNQTYGTNWEIPRASAHMPSLFGTNLFVVLGAHAEVTPVDNRKLYLHLAFGAGVIVIAVGLISLVPLVCLSGPNSTPNQGRRATTKTLANPG